MGIEKNQMGLGSVVALVVGNLIGAGIFLLPKNLAPYGWVSLLGMGITTVGAISLALIFAHLSRLVPKTGGPYVFTEEAFGKKAALIVAWLYWLMASISNAALCVAVVSYLQSIISLTPFYSFLSTILVLGVTICLNLLSLHSVDRIEISVTILKVIPLILLPFFGLFSIKSSYIFEAPLSQESLWNAIQNSSFILVWAFIGVESGTIPGKEVINPEKTIPRATLLGTGLTAFIYVVGILAMIGNLPLASIATSEAPYADLASVLWGGDWRKLVAWAAILSSAGALNGWILVSARIPYAAAKEGLFPAFFAKTTSAGTPLTGTLASGVIGLCTLFIHYGDLSSQFDTILNISVLLILVVYLVCIAAYFVILARSQELKATRCLIGLLSFAFVGFVLLKSLRGH